MRSRSFEYGTLTLNYVYIDSIAFPPPSFVLIENKNFAPIIVHVHYGYCWLLISVHVFEKGLFICLLLKVKGKV